MRTKAYHGGVTTGDVTRVGDVVTVAGGGEAGDAHVDAHDRPGPENGWTEQLVRRMFKESGDPMQRLLRMLAEADGEEVSTNEIAAALDLPKGASSVAGMAGAIGRRVKSRYGMKGLPWETRWRHIDPTDETKGTETLISLPKWICKVIRDL